MKLTLTNKQNIEIRQKLNGYLLGELSLAQFDQWFGEQWTAILEANSYDAEQLASQVELLLAEYSSGYLTKKELNSKLAGLSDYYNLTNESVSNKASSSSRVFLSTFGAMQSGYKQLLVESL